MEFNKIKDEEQNKEEEQFNDLPLTKRKLIDYDNSEEKEEIKTPVNIFKNDKQNIFKIEYDENISKEMSQNDIETKNTSNLNEPKIIRISAEIINISVSADLGTNIDLKKVARNENSLNIIYDPIKNNFLTKFLEGTNITANIFSKGGMVCSGIKSTDNIKKTVHKFGKFIRKCGYKIKKITNIKINSMIGQYNVNFKMNLQKLFQNLIKIPRSKKDNPPYWKRGKCAGIYYPYYTDKSKLCAVIHTKGNIKIFGGKSEYEINKLLNIIYPKLLESKIQ